LVTKSPMRARHAAPRFPPPVVWQQLASSTNAVRAEMFLHMRANRRALSLSPQMGLVQAVTRLTKATSGEEFLERFGERVRALAATRTSLSKPNGVGSISMSRLVLSSPPLQTARATA